MQKKIIIVDDQKGVRRLLEELFKKDDWIVHTASDGSEAISKVDELQPDIILMDMKMPNMNGLEASKQILSVHPEKIIIMMTAYGEMDVIKTAMEAGVKKCVTKPFDIMNLKEIVNNLASEQIR